MFCEVSVSIYELTQHHILKLHLQCCENLKFCLLVACDRSFDVCLGARGAYIELSQTQCAYSVL